MEGEREVPAVESPLPRQGEVQKAGLWGINIIYLLSETGGSAPGYIAGKGTDF